MGMNIIFLSKDKTTTTKLTDCKINGESAFI